MKYFLENIPKDEPIHNLLCLGGGGSRGYITLQTLARIEDEYKSKLYSAYDMICGSSVGAINGALIATGKFTVNEILDFYPKLVKKIFTPAASLFKWYPKYDREIFKKEWINLFGDIRFGDVKTNLLITSVNRITETTEYFKSWEETTFSSPNDPIVDIIMRSFAAPVYFGQIADKKNQAIWLDGGCGSFNIPALQLKNEAEGKDWYENKNHTLIHILGTGYIAKRNKEAIYKDEYNDKMFKQLFNGFINPMSGGLARVGSLDEQINTLTYIAKRKPNFHFKYFDAIIDKKYDPMDKVDDTTLSVYKLAGMKMAEKPVTEVI
jgi:hypothetical protein